MAVCLLRCLLKANRDLEKTGKEIHETLQSVVETRRRLQGVTKTTPRGGIPKDQLGGSHCSAAGVTPGPPQKEVQVPFLWE